MSQDETQPRHAKRLTGFTKAILGVIAGALLVAAIGVVYVGWQLTKTQDVVQAQAVEGKDLAATVDDVCKSGGVEAKKLQAAGKCEQAKQVIDRPAEKGPQGDPGAAGERGPKGDPGTPCLPANPGCRGPRGEPGKSPACLLLVAKCVGPAGIPGAQGKPGVDGKAGADGVDGQSPPCLSEPAQCQGADGKNGVDGTNGTNGQDGADGTDGKDGADGAAGATGRGIVSMICPPDDNDPLTDQAWVINWTSDPLQTEGGVCRAKTL